MASDMRAFCTPATSTHVSSHSPPIVDELISKYSSSIPNTTAESYRKQHRNLALRIIDWVCLEYYRYEVTFGVYVMSPGEKFVANTFVLVFFSLLFWASLLYLPPLLFSKLGRLVWLLTGHGEHTDSVLGGFDAEYIPAVATSTMAS
ncbi:hypothetical protein PISL3812_01011 [Talaromyces islandicus]|uniref:Uncharacterized protein n=1 Tax=Talaromyces islandicus TaxID=28573 RepID=A0A0U1LML1_TALIS|nr:hypothetical protein PISL3812_01011 [Talaromyces islandicus]